jgi:hypothetical protein
MNEQHPIDRPDLVLDKKHPQFKRVSLHLGEISGATAILANSVIAMLYERGHEQLAKEVTLRVASYERDRAIQRYEAHEKANEK